MNYGPPGCEMQTSITIERLLGHSAVGASPVYDTATTAKGHYEQGIKHVVNANGELILGSGMAILPAGIAVGISDRITVGGVVYKVIDVQVCSLMSKAHHIEVILQEVAQ